MTPTHLSNVIGFDDAPFERDHRGKVEVVGTVYAGLRFDGVLIGAVEKDGETMRPRPWPLWCADQDSPSMPG